MYDRCIADNRFTLTPFVPVKYTVRKNIHAGLSAFIRNGRLYVNQPLTAKADLLSLNGRLLTTFAIVNGKADVKVRNGICVLKIEGTSRGLQLVVK